LLAGCDTTLDQFQNSIVCNLLTGSASVNPGGKKPGLKVRSVALEVRFDGPPFRLPYEELRGFRDST
jgi:hypothetical protein